MSSFISQLYILCFRDVRTFIEANNDVILICTSILSFSKVLNSMPFDCLKKSTTLFVDVLSVKEHPRELLLRVILYYFFYFFCHFLFFVKACLVFDTDLTCTYTFNSIFYYVLKLLSM